MDSEQINICFSPRWLISVMPVRNVLLNQFYWWYFKNGLLSVYPFCLLDDAFQSSPILILFKAMIKKLEKDLALGGVAVGSPGVLWQMLLARENSIFRPTCRVCLHLQLLDGHLSLHFPPSLICVASLLRPLILQTLLSSSVLTALSAFLLFPLGFVCPPSSSRHLPHPSSLNSKPAPPLDQLPGPHVGPAHVVGMCSYESGGDGRTEEWRVESEY